MSTPHPPHGATAAETGSADELFGGPLHTEDPPNAPGTLPAMICALPAAARSVWDLARAADRAQLWRLLAGELTQGLCALGSLLALSSLLEALLSISNGTAAATALIPAATVLASLAALAALGRALSTAAAAALEPRIARRATERYLHLATRIELIALEDPRYQRLLDIARTGASSAPQVVIPGVQVLNGFVSMATAVVALAILNPLLISALLLAAAGRCWGALRVTRNQRTWFLTWIIHQRATDLLTFLPTLRSTAAEIRVHDAGRFLRAHYRALSATAEDAQDRLGRTKARIELTAAALAGVASMAGYATLAWLTVIGHTSLAVTGAAVMALRTGNAQVSTVILQLNRLYENALHVRDLDEATRTAQPLLLTAPAGPTLKPFESLTLDRIHFTYPGRNQPALSDVSVTVPAGALIAIVGDNGSGKSTLVKILAGLYAPDSGTMRWNGTVIDTPIRAGLFPHVSLLTQDFPTWPFTAATNISMGRTDRPPSQKHWQQAARFAHADTVISQLPAGRLTPLAPQIPGASQLSGGQWQRIALARAVYRHAALTILDEPTSALDPDTERTISTALPDLTREGRSVVLITHRMAAVQQADFIYVLHHGRIVEQGTHNALIRQAGRYEAMYRAQAEHFTHPHRRRPARQRHHSAFDAQPSSASAAPRHPPPEPPHPAGNQGP